MKSPVRRVRRYYRQITMSGDLGNVYALSGELRNELDLKRTLPLPIFATVNARVLSGDLRNRTLLSD
jgi:hypothetical protein